MRAAIQYADRQVVRDWVETIYLRMEELIQLELWQMEYRIQQQLKIDVKVEITNDKGRLSQGVDINVSLKIDHTAFHLDK